MKREQQIAKMLREALEKQKTNTSKVCRLMPDYLSQADESCIEQSYKDAHDIARFILNISKIKSISQVHPTIKFDEEQQLFYTAIDADQAEALLGFLDHPPTKKQRGALSKTSLQNMLARIIAPFAGSNYASRANEYFHQSFATYQLPDDYIGEDLQCLTNDGNYVDAQVIARHTNADSNSYVIGCHGNACHYRQLMPIYENIASKTNCKVVAFDYRGYGLSAGKIQKKQDFYEDGFAIAKHCVDKGATYIFLDGVSIGGAVAAHTAARLKKYCEQQKKQVVIEQGNMVSLSSTSDIALGFLRETDFKTGNRSKPGFFRKFFATLLSPFIKLALYLNNFDMDPKKEISKMPENSYEVVSGKSDTLIGTYASMEYQLRQQNKNDLNRLQQRREALLKKMIELKNSLLKYLVMPPNLNQQLISKIVSKMTAEEIRRYLKKEAAALDILTEVSAYEAEFLQLALQQKFKESRLMYTEATKNYADFTGNKLYSTHNELVHLKSDTITALDREIVFINSRDCRAAKIPHDLDQLTTFKDKLRHALTFFGPKSNSCTNACELPKEAIGFKL